jgi:eukaryotic-like serine/threonine-protein kinase
MTPERWQQVKLLLAQAMEAPHADRHRFLNDRCGGDSELLLEVESLLEHASGEVQVQEKTARTSLDETRDVPVESVMHLRFGIRTGQTIGPYRIERLLGEGGMGSVHLAVREVDGYEMRVALKIMRVAALNDYSMRRFRMERQILARLSHPNITRLLDGGVTAEGLPYLVTEYVEGLPLDQFCTQKQPPLEARLRVFLDVVNALSFAHRNLIVHGDIKPANILVTSEGTAKLVDFGIARLVDPESSSSNGSTTTFALTPGWASPEQLRGDPPSVLADLYSAGRVFYELIAGQNSHSLSGLPPQRYLEVLSNTPGLPSQVSGEKALEGDLDNIALKAVEFEPEQRYQSADQFGEDIRAYLESRPISARRATWRYRAEKFTRRHRRAVVLGGLVTAALISLIAATLIQASAAREQYAAAARQALAVRKLANTFVFDLDDAVAEMPGATQIRARIMQSAVEYLDRLAKESAGNAELQYELGLAYTKVGDVLGLPGGSNLGKTVAALENYRKAEFILEPLARGPQATQDQKFHLAALYMKISAVLKVVGDFRVALEYDLKSLGIRQALVQMNPADQVLKRALAQSLTSLGGTYSQLGEWSKVLESRQRALKMSEELVAVNKKSVADRRSLVLARTRLASILSREKRHAAALEQLRIAVSEQKALVDENPVNSQISLAYGSTLSALARGLDEAGDIAGALHQHEAAEKIYEAEVTADPVDVRARSLLGTARASIGRLLARSGRASAALPYLERALQTRLYLSERDPANTGALGEVADSHAALGEAYAALHRPELALQSYTNAKQILDDLVADGRAHAADRTLLSQVVEESRRLGAH